MWPLRKLESSSHKISAMKVLGLVESENLSTNLEKHNNLADTLGELWWKSMWYVVVSLPCLQSCWFGGRRR